MHPNVTLRKHKHHDFHTPRQHIRVASREATSCARDDSDRSATANIHNNDAAGLHSHEAQEGLRNRESFDPQQGQPSQPVKYDSSQQLNTDFHAAWKPEGDRKETLLRTNISGSHRDSQSWKNGSRICSRPELTLAAGYRESGILLKGYRNRGGHRISQAQGSKCRKLRNR